MIGQQTSSTHNTQFFVINQQAFLHLVFKIVTKEWVGSAMKRDGPCVDKLLDLDEEYIESFTLFYFYLDLSF